jgi:hypothetical protein
MRIGRLQFRGTMLSRDRAGAESNVRLRSPGAAANRQTVTAAFSASHNATPVQTNVIVIAALREIRKARCAVFA